MDGFMIGDIKYDKTGSVTYDLSLFSSEKQERRYAFEAMRNRQGFNNSQKEDEISQKEGKISRNDKAKMAFEKADRILPGNIICFAIVVVLAVGMLFLRARVTEVTSQLNQVEKEIVRAQAEYDYIQYEIDAMYSYDKLEEAARAIGMEPMYRGQIRYIDLELPDKVVVNGKTVSGE